MMTSMTRCGWSVVIGAALCATVLAGRLSRAGESLVWELKPYRIQVLLVPDWTPDWSDQQMAQIGRSVVRRARVEIGRPWQLDVRSAPLAIRRFVLSSKSLTGLEDYSRLLAPYRDRDKVILVLLRVESGRRGAEAWELDWASKRWSASRRYRAHDGTGMQQAVFESIDSVVSPLGLVKLASGQRVVLRQRAALLPVRNRRRVTVEVGSLFQVLRRDRKESMPNAQDATLLVVEEMGEQGVICRVVSRSGNPLERTPLDQWIAVQARLNHANTRFRLTKVQRDAIEPLTECEVWVSDRRADQGTLVGCPDSAGDIVLPAAGKVQWLKIKVGAVTLSDYCVLAGVHDQQMIHTQLTSAQLLHAGILAASRDDVVQLLTLRDTYLARHQYRRDAGRDDDAKAVLDEMRKLLEQRAPVLLEAIRKHRDEVIALGSSEASRFAPQWSELISTLSELAKEQ